MFETPWNIDFVTVYFTSKICAPDYEIKCQIVHLLACFTSSLHLFLAGSRVVSSTTSLQNLRDATKLFSKSFVVCLPLWNCITGFVRVVIHLYCSVGLQESGTWYSLANSRRWL